MTIEQKQMTKQYGECIFTFHNTLDLPDDAVKHHIISKWEVRYDGLAIGEVLQRYTGNTRAYPGGTGREREWRYTFAFGSFERSGSKKSMQMCMMVAVDMLDIKFGASMLSNSALTIEDTDLYDDSQED